MSGGKTMVFKRPTQAPKFLLQIYGHRPSIHHDTYLTRHLNDASNPVVGTACHDQK